MDHKTESVEFIMKLRDNLHPLYALEYVARIPLSAGWEEDVKRKGIISDMVQRITRLEERVRKLETKT